MELQTSELQTSQSSELQNTQSSDWAHLDANVLEYLFSFLPFQDVLQSGIVCKKWFRVSSMKRIWMNFYLEDRVDFVITEDSVHDNVYCAGVRCTSKSHYDPETLQKKSVKRLPKDPKKSFIRLQLTKYSKTKYKQIDRKLDDVNWKLQSAIDRVHRLQEAKRELEFTSRVNQPKLARMKAEILEEKKRKREEKANKPKRKCGNCGERGHNRKRCKKPKVEKVGKPSVKKRLKKE